MLEIVELTHEQCTKLLALVIEILVETVDLRRPVTALAAISAWPGRNAATGAYGSPAGLLTNPGWIEP
jgi:hypothetical protein